KILEATPDAIVMIDQEGEIVFINTATVKLFGYEKEELLGQKVEILIPEPYRGRHPEHRHNFFKEPRSRAMGSGMELFGQRKNKEIFPVEISISPLETKDGLVGLAAIRDITLQKQAYQYARSLIEASLDPLVTISPDGKITDVNEATVQVTGVMRENLIGSDFSNYFTEPEEARDGYKQVFKEGFVRDYPLAIRHLYGNITNVVYNASVYKDATGKVLGVFAAARDITQRKKAEEQQHATSAYARSLIESSLDPLVMISPEGKITDVNHATEQITGVMREWLIGSDFSNYFTEPRKARESYRLVLKEGSLRDYPLAIRHASGKVIEVLYNASVYRDATGKVQGVFAAARDVTESKKNSQYARSLIEASLDPLMTISLEGKITDVNEATVQVTGLNREELIGTDFSIYFTEPQTARKGYEEAFEKGFVKDYALTIRHKNGKLTDVLYNASVYKDNDGNVLGVFAAARDYSLVKRTTEKLETSNQELDAFTYSVAHDLKAPLRAIDGFSKILMQDYNEKLDEEGKRILATVVGNTEKMGKLIEDLLALSHIGRHEIKKEYMDMHALVESIAKDLIHSMPNRQITLDLKKLESVKCDPALIRQVWLNLISNAIKFTQTKKNALIEIGSLSDVNFVTYYVKDNGLGFDMKYLDKLFGVFQRLHGKEIEGTGIGLANVKRIITRHGGKAWGEGKIGVGASFYFTLPRD
ncbi:MAG: PAS domain S-box protein, partial [Gammaproteobacteria bacterium]|nr:PAS domain S-box protein [Gammaproteobacteria bacterium]